MKSRTPPNLKTAGFSLWIHGREFPDTKDAYTADWLIVSAQLDTGNGRSWVKSCAALQSQELENFVTLAKSADWTAEEMLIEAPIMEFEIQWAFIKDKRYPNRIIFRVQVNKNFFNETHIGYFKISFIEANQFLDQLSKILSLYPNLQKSE